MSWHGQVHELERCLDTQRGGADWRSILKAYILLQPKRDLDFGFGTLYQRLLHHPLKPKYSLRTYQLVSEDVRCRDFCPAHIIVEKALPYINVDFWGGWPPPPALIPLPAPRKKPRLVVMSSSPASQLACSCLPLGHYLLMLLLLRLSRCTPVIIAYSALNVAALYCCLPFSKSRLPLLPFL